MPKLVIEESAEVITLEKKKFLVYLKSLSQNYYTRVAVKADTMSY